MDAAADQESVIEEGLKVLPAKTEIDKLSKQSKHIVKKRLPTRITGSNKHIYVTNKTNFKAQLRKCEKLLDADEPEIVIHGLGAAITKACELALKIKEIHHGTIDLDVNTSTVDLIDDLEPLNDEEDYEVRERRNSAINIRVFRKVIIGDLKFSK